LNEQVNDRYLFGGINANEAAPVVELTRLPDPTGSANSASAGTTQQLAAGTIRQVVRIITDQLGNGQNETLNVDGPKGWVLVCTDGFSLGWGKLSDGILKNYYPAWWRWNS
jgi:hypothetical protein